MSNLICHGPGLEMAMDACTFQQVIGSGKHEDQSLTSFKAMANSQIKREFANKGKVYPLTNKKQQEEKVIVLRLKAYPFPLS